ncbi:MAG: hypothetical protein ABI158_09725, partial [Edaphobacter sp.]
TSSMGAVSSSRMGSMYAQAVGDDSDNKCKDDNGRPVKCAVVDAPSSNMGVGLAAAAVGLGLAVAIASSGGHKDHPISGQ